MACSWIVAGVLEGGDWMGNFRFFMPAMALFILSLYGYLETISTLYDLRWRGALVMFCLLLFVVFSVYNTVRSSKVTDNQLVMNNLEYHWIKNWLVSHQLNSIAAIDIGELGYSSVLEILDLGGLTDRYIAKLAGIHMDKTIPIDYVLKKKPDVVLIRLNNKLEGSNIKTADIMSTVEAGIIFDPEFQKHYAPVFITAPHYYRQPFYGIMVFLHKAISSEKVLDTVNITYENGIPFVYFEPIDQLFIKNK
jgi:hypothetical protein